MVNESIDHENDVTFDIMKGKLKHEMIQIEYFHSPLHEMLVHRRL